MPRLAVTSKEGQTVALVLRRYHLIAADGTLNAFGAISPIGQIESPLIEGDPVVMRVTFDRVRCPASMTMITGIQPGTRLGETPSGPHPERQCSGGRAVQLHARNRVMSRRG